MSEKLRLNEVLASFIDNRYGEKGAKYYAQLLPDQQEFAEALQEPMVQEGAVAQQEGMDTS